MRLKGGCRRLLLHLDRDPDRLQRVVPFVTRDGGDLIDDVEAPEDFPKDGIAPIKAVIVIQADEELRAVVVEVAGAVALAGHFGHGDGAALVGAVVRFGRKKIAGPSGAVQGSIRLFAERIAALEQKARYDAVERGAVEESQPGEIEKVFDVTRGVVGIEANGNLSKFCDDGEARIFFLELHRHSGTLSRTALLRQGRIERGKVR
ncbi:protein of unknown function [Candidatus Nitrospira inopinata]|uniref:Uncharacterized protein n=1 Tax=Candidatus Nitrospira inopinata TaxID=1715989 RepID=A0A0S4KZL4_9BACT|nr:protein of unknown function [Candidatus Nitrospira inopinata]